MISFKTFIITTESQQTESIQQNIIKNEEKLEKAIVLHNKKIMKCEEYKEWFKKNNIDWQNLPDGTDFETFEKAEYVKNWNEEGVLYTERNDSDKKIQKIKDIIESWNVKLTKAVEKEAKIDKMPEVLLRLIEELKVDYYDADIKRREYLRLQYNTLSYKDFVKEFGGRAVFEIRMTDDEIRKESDSRAYYEVQNLFDRVKKITGDNIINYNNIHLSAKELNGYIIGDKGTAEVHTIYAGGYNIQRLHLRVLVNRK